MTMTLGELKVPITRPFDGENASLVASYVNRAQNEIAKLSRMRKRANATIAGDGSITVPTDCLLVKTVYFDGYPLNDYAEDNIPGDGAIGTPLYWLKMDSGNIQLYPIPDRAGLSVQLVYVPIPAPVKEDKDTPGIADADEYLIAYCIAKIMAETNGIDKESEAWGQKADIEMAKWLQFNGEKNRRPRRVKFARWT